jgi:hypothetical protein
MPACTAQAPLRRSHVRACTVVTRRMDDLSVYDYTDMAWEFYAKPGGVVGEMTVTMTRKSDGASAGCAAHPRHLCCTTFVPVLVGGSREG